MLGRMTRNQQWRVWKRPVLCAMCWQSLQFKCGCDRCWQALTFAACSPCSPCSLVLAGACCAHTSTLLQVNMHHTVLCHSSHYIHPTCITLWCGMHHTVVWHASQPDVACHWSLFVIAHGWVCAHGMPRLRGTTCPGQPSVFLSQSSTSSFASCMYAYLLHTTVELWGSTNTSCTRQVCIDLHHACRGPARGVVAPCAGGLHCHVSGLPDGTAWDAAAAGWRIACRNQPVQRAARM